ncbi:hypothetical protein G5B35_22120 [Parapusillimonas sp. SGNA-6]|uniref:hypothetical protein n=1 Tax=Parapedobacter sp. SGR-10 TaxID=2710879 RepID=UPI0013D332D4|nr:hypothetical protein [Parapedobacter sp. SGR-10]NGF55527.1 hypothetical protein [Parapedobacter sp. SGR-10]NGM89996.1 hypothetical protein [Parapusillimonas sp. SGNA-6]
MKKGIKIAVMCAIALATVGAVVMLLWNALITDIFGLTEINFWQALGLFLLSRILLGRFGFGGNRMMMHEKRNAIREKWMKMSPEQRKEFINKRRKFGFGNSCGIDHFDMEKHEEQDNGER